MKCQQCPQQGAGKGVPASHVCNVCKIGLCPKHAALVIAHKTRLGPRDADKSLPSPREERIFDRADWPQYFVNRDGTKYPILGPEATAAAILDAIRRKDLILIQEAGGVLPDDALTSLEKMSLYLDSNTIQNGEAIEWFIELLMEEIAWKDYLYKMALKDPENRGNEMGISYLKSQISEIAWTDSFLDQTPQAWELVIDALRSMF